MSERRPRGAVARRLEERVVEVLLDREVHLGGQRAAARDGLRHRGVDVVAHRAVEHVRARLRRPDAVDPQLVGQDDEQRLRLLGRGVVRAELVLGLRSGEPDVVERSARAARTTEPAELEQLPRTEIGRVVADPVRAAVADVRTGRHEGPESRSSSLRHPCCRRCRRDPAGRGRARTRARRRRGRRSRAGSCSRRPRRQSGCSGDHPGDRPRRRRYRR